MGDKVSDPPIQYNAKARSVARFGSECPLEAGRMEWQSSSSKLVVARQEDVPNVVHEDSWDAGLSMPGSR